MPTFVLENTSPYLRIEALSDLAHQLSDKNPPFTRRGDMFSLPFIPSASINWYRSKVFARAHGAISEPKFGDGKGWGLFGSDWREGAVFSRFIYGGNPWPRAKSRGTAGGGRTPP
jgi:hypothetical protein